MFRTILVFSVTLLATACVPITQERSVTTDPDLVPANEQISDCPNGEDLLSLQIINNHFEISPGQRTTDPVATALPGYIDLAGVESSLIDETLTAVFHLRELPEELEFRRAEVGEGSEYMWSVYIDLEGEGGSEFNRFDYLFTVFSSLSLRSDDGSPLTLPTEDGIEVVLMELYDDGNKGSNAVMLDLESAPELHVSFADKSLTLVSEIPGITTASTLFFLTVDKLFGFDSVSCQPVDA